MVSCQRVLQELSGYIDDAIDSRLRAEIEEHLRGCRRCSVVLDTTRKTIQIYCDGNVLDVPGGYSERLRHFFLSQTQET